MGFEFTDGKGRGYSAGVNKDNLMETLAIGKTESSFVASESEGSYFFTTNVINPNTISAESAIAMIRHTGAEKFSLETLGMSCNGECVFRVYKNVSSVTNIASSSAVNSNFGSGKTFNGGFEIGGGTSSISADGTLIGTHIVSSDDREINLEGSIILGKNNTFVVTAELAASATSVETTILGFESEIV